MDTLVSPVKTTQPIKMPFGFWAWMSSGNDLLDAVPDLPMGTDNFEG